MKRTSLCLALLVAGVSGTAVNCRETSTSRGGVISRTVVGKWIQELKSKPTIYQTEFKEDGTVEMWTYEQVSPDTARRLQQQGIDLATLRSISQPRRALTYYSLDKPLLGTWKLDGRVLTQTVFSEVYGQVSMRCEIRGITDDSLVVHFDNEPADIIYTAQGKWEDADGPAAPWIIPTAR